jgi:ATP-dependent DNA helicase RecG
LRESLPVAGRVQSDVFERVDDPLYPPVALREALANAFCHRDYSVGGGSVAVAVYDDRLEITSTGTLHFGLTPEMLYRPHESLPWNPLIAQAFYRRGIIESWGRGILKMAELTEAVGLSRPSIEAGAGAVVVTFYPNTYVAPRTVNHNLTERQRRILQVLGNSPEAGLNINDIINQIEAEQYRRGVKDDLRLLKEMKKIRLVGHAKTARWYLVDGLSPSQSVSIRPNPSQSEKAP